MRMRQRSLIILGMAAAASVLYVAALRLSPELVTYIVGKTLLEKSQPHIEQEQAKRRFEQFLSAAPDPDARLARTLELSQALEKVQRVSPSELDSIFAVIEQKYENRKN